MKTCPFCGGEGELRSFRFPTSKHNEDETLFFVACTQCEDIYALDSGVAESAVRHWNHRLFTKETLMLRNHKLRVEDISDDAVMNLGQASVEACRKEWLRAYRQYFHWYWMLKKAKTKASFKKKYSDYKSAVTRYRNAERDIRQNLFINFYSDDPETILDDWRRDNRVKKIDEFKDKEWADRYDHYMN